MDNIKKVIEQFRDFGRRAGSATLKFFPRILAASMGALALLFLSSFLVTEEEYVVAELPAPPPPQLAVEDNEPAPQSLHSEKVNVRLQSGESLALLFDRLKLSRTELTELVNGLSRAEQRSISRLAKGTNVEITLQKTPEGQDKMQELVVMQDALKGKRYYRKPTGEMAVENYKVEYQTEHKYAGGDISSSLYADGLKQGFSSRSILNFAGIFAYDIDFANDLRPGDKFSALFEQPVVNNRSVGREIIAVAQFVNQGKSITAFRYTDANGEVGYFTADGRSMQARFLRMPMSVARVSSRFSKRRFHPVLKIFRPHQGVDFAARSGTPIFATAIGKISFAGSKGGYGKTIIINHGDGYSTLYAHMRGYARGMKRGKRVKQGQVIGYVGSTGVSTGPHLHYEFRVRGRHVDPLRQVPERKVHLAKDELPRFLRQINPLREKHASLQELQTELASKVN